jgi:hypothetical protein
MMPLSEQYSLRRGCFRIGREEKREVDIARKRNVIEYFALSVLKNFSLVSLSEGCHQKILRTLKLVPTRMVNAQILNFSSSTVN